MPVFTLPDEKFAACAGFDALAMTRTLKLLLLMSCYVTLTVMVLVLPVNVTGGFVDTQPLRNSQGCEEVGGDAEEQGAVRRLHGCALLDVCTEPGHVVVALLQRTTGAHHEQPKCPAADASCWRAAHVRSTAHR